MILLPPEAPITSFTSPLLSVMIDGLIDDMGRLRGLMKFEGDGGRPNVLDMLGVEKSSISSLKSIPVRFPKTLDPKLKRKHSLDRSIGRSLKLVALRLQSLFSIRPWQNHPSAARVSSTSEAQKCRDSVYTYVQKCSISM